MVVCLFTDQQQVDFGVVVKCRQSQRYNLLGTVIVAKYVDSHFVSLFKHLDLVQLHWEGDAGHIQFMLILGVVIHSAFMIFSWMEMR